MTNQPDKNEPHHMGHVRRYQASNGEDGGFNSHGQPVLLITTTGRKSGKPRTNPVVYMAEGETTIIVGSNAGRPPHSQWYLNLRENPEVRVQVKADIFEATAREAEGEEREALWEKFTADAPYFQEYEDTTERRIPVIVLERRS